MSVYENSRYLRTRLVTRNDWDTPFLQSRVRFNFNPEACVLHEWCEGDTLDGVAFKYYGISELRWAILDANSFKYRTEFDIQNGDKIFIPDLDEVVSIVNV